MAWQRVLHAILLDCAGPLGKGMVEACERAEQCEAEKCVLCTMFKRYMGREYEGHADCGYHLVRQLIIKLL